MKKFIVLCLLFNILPALADDADINLTPKNNFSGYNSSINTNYPHLNTSSYQHGITLEQQRKQWMKPTSVRSMNTVTTNDEDRGSVTFNKFPQSYDSSDMMHVQQVQQGIQNMYMGL